MWALGPWNICTTRKPTLTTSWNSTPDCRCALFHSWTQKVHSPAILKGKCTSDVARIGSIIIPIRVLSPNISSRKSINDVARIGSTIIFHLSKLWKAKFFIHWSPFLFLEPESFAVTVIIKSLPQIAPRSNRQSIFLYSWLPYVIAGRICSVLWPYCMLCCCFRWSIRARKWSRTSISPQLSYKWVVKSKFLISIRTRLYAVKWGENSDWASGGRANQDCSFSRYFWLPRNALFSNVSLWTLSLPTSKSTFCEPFKEKCTSYQRQSSSYCVM